MPIQPTSPTAVQFASAQAAGKAGTSLPTSGSAAAALPASAVNETAPAAAASQQDTEKLKAAVERAQVALAPLARDITFSMNEKAGAVVVKIIERESKEVIRQIPSEEFLKIAEALNEQIDSLRAGLLVEQKA